MKKIYLSEYGIMPDTDITLSLFSLFQQNMNDCEFVFEKGDYFLSPHHEMHYDYKLSNSDPLPFRMLGVWMKNMKNCVVNGNGSCLYFSGQMQPFTLDGCENVKICNFTVNWKKPLVAEGEVLNVGDGFLDVYIDGEKFPHRMNDGIFEFDTGADEWYKATGWLIAFEPHDRRARRGIADFCYKKVTKIADDIYRLETNGACVVKVGDFLNIRHNARVHAGVFSEKCTDMVVENVTFYSCPGLGCLAQFCHNLTYRAVNFLPDTASGRYVSSGRDDGMHITCCSGRVTISECSFHALMDDPINVHGCCVTSDEVVDEFTLRCKYRHPMACAFKYWAEKGDEIAFIARDAMNRVAFGNVVSYTLEDDETFVLKFDFRIPDEVLALAEKKDSLALENLTKTAEFFCTHNRFGSCRARGVLVATPKKVVISDNYFETSGSAILVAGDSNYWFESGECGDVEISNNIFTNACLSSEYQFCDGIISITPVVPKPVLSKPFHKNIRITSNTFDTPQNPVLSAFSCEKLVFSDNTVYKSPSAEKWHHKEKYVNLSFCRKADIKNNLTIGFGQDEFSAWFENCEEINCDI